MALAEKPRNNLHQHLAWFNSQKPQIPLRGRVMPATHGLPAPDVTIGAQHSLPAIQSNAICVPLAATSMPAQALPVARRSDTEIMLLEFNHESLQTVAVSQSDGRKTMASQLRNHLDGRPGDLQI